jgi:uncharacterized membrane protein
VRLRFVSLGLLSILFIGAGILHLISPAPFIAIVPLFLPYPNLAVLVSGIAEIGGGMGILMPATRRLSRWGLVALLIAVFPANIYMAARHIEPSGMDIPNSVLWARLALQPLLIWWVMWATKTVRATA